jgi:3D (Asp-Asp-Asp) domain-containing protein
VPRSSPAAKPEAAAKPTPAQAAALTGRAGKKVAVELTGFSFHDNTPEGSPAVCCGVLHRTAGGKGTFADPITVAVAGSDSSMAFKAGTRFYLPRLQRYVIVEDSGASSGSNHLDVWIDGRDGSKSVTDACMDRITGDSTGELNPPPGRPVIVGPIFSRGKCKLPSRA